MHEMANRNMVKGSEMCLSKFGCMYLMPMFWKSCGISIL